MTKLWVLVQLAVALSVAGGTITTGTLPATAQASEGVGERESGRVEESEPPIHLSTPLPNHLSTPQPATTVEEWLAQIEASLVQITEVRVEETETGLQVVLETAEGDLATPTITVSGNAAISEIPDAVLALPKGDSFEKFSPAEGIALVQVTALAGNRVQVAITGTEAVPDVEVGTEAAGLTLSVVPGMAQAGEAGEAI